MRISFASWFDLPRFYQEARRVLIPGEGTLAIWTYGLAVLPTKEANDVLSKVLHSMHTGLTFSQVPLRHSERLLGGQPLSRHVRISSGTAMLVHAGCWFSPGSRMFADQCWRVALLGRSKAAPREL
jgi:hypothetical protein